MVMLNDVNSNVDNELFELSVTNVTVLDLGRLSNNVISSCLYAGFDLERKEKNADNCFISFHFLEQRAQRCDYGAMSFHA